MEIYQIDYGTEFKKEVKRLSVKKRFHSLPAQILTLEKDIKSGLLNGDIVFHRNVPVPMDVYKLRLANPDANAGKSNGYRVIYVVATENKLVVLLTIYYKKEQANILDSQIADLISGYFMHDLPDEDLDDEDIAEWGDILQ